MKHMKDRKGKKLNMVIARMKKRNKKNESPSSSNFLMGLLLGFIAGIILGMITELPISNLVKIFSDAGDTTGLIFVKFLMFGFIGMFLGSFGYLLTNRK